MDKNMKIFVAIGSFCIVLILGFQSGIQYEQSHQCIESSDLFEFVAGDRIQTTSEYNEMFNKSYSGVIIGIDDSLIGFYDADTDILKALDEIWLEWER